MVARFVGRAVHGRRAGIRALAVAILLLTPALAPAQDAPEDVARRMDDRLYFVESLARGWEPLLSDIGAAIESLPEAERVPVARVRDTASERYADLRLRDQTEAGTKRAFDLLVTLSRDAVDGGRRPEFARRAADIEVAWARTAEKAGDDRRALDLALSAATRSPGFEPAYDLIARLGVKQADRAEAEEEYAEAFEILDRSATLLPETTPARATLETKRQAILSATGVVEVEWLGSPERLAQVKGPKTEFASATIEFRPADAASRAPKPKAIGRPMRVRNGTYTVVARGNGPDTFDAGRVVVSPSGARVQIPVALPLQMVLVRVDGQEPFLIDRCEVTVSELDRPGAGHTGGNRTAASGVDFARAQAYARAAGKDLPTLRQWFLAAFGDPDGRARRFPWGDQPGSPGVHFVGGAEGPRAVDSCPSGASFAGCLNMAGNVMEWLGDAPRGRFIGGSYRRDQFSYTVQPKDESSGQQWEADFLRTPIPSYETWDAMPTAEREKYWNFKASEDGSTYAQVGLRCVVPLRRQP